MSKINWRKVFAVVDAVWRFLLMVVALVSMFHKEYAGAAVLLLILVSAQLAGIEKALRPKRTFISTISTTTSADRIFRESIRAAEKKADR